MPPLDVSPELRAQVEAVTKKRARFVLDFILQHGAITAIDIQDGGYREHRRAVMDCRDLGFPIKNAASPGKGIGAWTLDTEAENFALLTGRKNFSKKFRQGLTQRAGGRCEVCGAPAATRNLQIDHRIPHEIDPGSGAEAADEYQMLCGSCNRTKSRTCESDCPNWVIRDPGTCTTCMWAQPHSYQHIATVVRRQVTVTWDGDEAAESFRRLAETASSEGISVEAYLRRLAGE